MPDTGSMMFMTETSTDRASDVMEGDRLYTDIALGEAGLTMVLVLSGEADQQDLPGAPRQPICSFPPRGSWKRLFRSVA
ncbi:MAG: HAD hydrolase-like protein [Anaerolineales bacterium]|nr:HAD hydrolase-like protein [Anaerolineales bacterium]